jgi:hypothetical protein
VRLFLEGAGPRLTDHINGSKKNGRARNH